MDKLVNIEHEQNLFQKYWHQQARTHMLTNRQMAFQKQMLIFMGAENMQIQQSLKIYCLYVKAVDSFKNDS
jgi:hypothetical protein